MECLEGRLDRWGTRVRSVWVSESDSGSLEESVWESVLELGWESG